MGPILLPHLMDEESYFFLSFLGFLTSRLSRLLPLPICGLLFEGGVLTRPAASRDGAAREFIRGLS